MRLREVLLAGFFGVVCHLRPTAEGASLSVRDMTISAGEVLPVIVDAHIDGEATYGVTVLIEIVGRTGNVGTVVFTPGPPSDIVQLGDPWPGSGTFTPYDTHEIGFSATRNGAIDDNGTFTPAPATFDGALAGFPIQASAGASGTWDVVLSTPVGDSKWEGVATTLVAGTVTVTGGAPIPAVSTWGMIFLALLVVTAASAMIRQDPPCVRVKPPSARG